MPFFVCAFPISLIVRQVVLERYAKIPPMKGWTTHETFHIPTSGIECSLARLLFGQLERGCCLLFSDYYVGSWCETVPKAMLRAYNVARYTTHG